MPNPGTKIEVAEGNRKMDIQTGNRLIAEFMGASFWEFANVWKADTDKCSIAHLLDNCDTPLQFHFSWDWLMPVVEKIEGLDEDKSVSITDKHCLIKGDHTTAAGWDIIISSNDGKTKIEAIWLAVISFIQWHKTHFLNPENLKR